MLLVGGSHALRPGVGGPTQFLVASRPGLPSPPLTGRVIGQLNLSQLGYPYSVGRHGLRCPVYSVYYELIMSECEM